MSLYEVSRRSCASHWKCFVVVVVKESGKLRFCFVHGWWWRSTLNKLERPTEGDRQEQNRYGGILRELVMAV